MISSYFTPNPVYDILTIRGEGIDTVKLVNILGQDVTGQVDFINNSKNFVQLDIKNLGKGYYLIHCNDEIYPVVVE